MGLKKKIDFCKAPTGLQEIIKIAININFFFSILKTSAIIIIKNLCKIM